MTWKHQIIICFQLCLASQPSFDAFIRKSEDCWQPSGKAHERILFEKDCHHFIQEIATALLQECCRCYIARGLPLLSCKRVATTLCIARGLPLLYWKILTTAILQEGCRFTWWPYASPLARLWIECIIVRPCTGAIQALTFSLYILKARPHTTTPFNSFSLFFTFHALPLFH